MMGAKAVRARAGSDPALRGKPASEGAAAAFSPAGVWIQRGHRAIPRLPVRAGIGTPRRIQYRDARLIMEQVMHARYSNDVKQLAAMHRGFYTLRSGAFILPAIVGLLGAAALYTTLIEGLPALISKAFAGYQPTPSGDDPITDLQQKVAYLMQALASARSLIVDIFLLVPLAIGLCAICYWLYLRGQRLDREVLMQRNRYHFMETVLNLEAIAARPGDPEGRYRLPPFGRRIGYRTDMLFVRHNDRYHQRLLHVNRRDLKTLKQMIQDYQGLLGRERWSQFWPLDQSDIRQFLRDLCIVQEELVPPVVELLSDIYNPEEEDELSQVRETFAQHWRVYETTRLGQADRAALGAAA